jgi:hypothetical protein
MPVEHLTPLRLICALPPGCPSRDPPLFNLVCMWLTAEQLSELCGQLDAVWADGGGVVGVYTWVEHLRDAGLLCLGSPPRVQLREPHATPAQLLHPGAAGGSLSTAQGRGRGRGRRTITPPPAVLSSLRAPGDHGGKVRTRIQPSSRLNL